MVIKFYSLCILCKLRNFTDYNFTEAHVIEARDKMCEEPKMALILNWTAVSVDTVHAYNKDAWRPIGDEG